MICKSAVRLASVYVKKPPEGLVTSQMTLLIFCPVTPGIIGIWQLYKKDTVSLRQAASAVGLIKFTSGLGYIIIESITELA